VVLDDLNTAAAPYGLRVGPDPPTHSRCKGAVAEGLDLGIERGTDAADLALADAVDPEGLDEVAQDRFNRTDWIELAAAVLLALATIAAAWSAYQATRWGGEQASASRSALSAKSDATQQTTISGAQVQVDMKTPCGLSPKRRRSPWPNEPRQTLLTRRLSRPTAN
jgi:hypothetical protein